MDFSVYFLLNHNVNVNEFLYHAMMNLFTSNDDELVYQLILN